VGEREGTRDIVAQADSKQQTCGAKASGCVPGRGRENLQHTELRCKGGVGSKVGWSKTLNKTVDYRVDSQVKVGMSERGFKEEGIREEMETREPRGKAQEGQEAEREHSTRRRAVVGRGTSWSAVHGTRSQLAQDRVNGRTN